MGSSENAITAGKRSRAAADLKLLSVQAAAWFESRKISPQTLERLPVESGTVYFPDVEKKLPAAIFRYANGDWKARSTEGKYFVASKGFHRAFWNLESVLAGKMDVVYLVEGELDACSLVEAGIPVDQVLATQGAPPKDAASTDAAYAYVTEALAAGLGRAKRFVWCGDEDDQGRLLRDHMALILGRAKFYFVCWPEPLKDANDTLMLEGPEDVQDRVLNGALPTHIPGLYSLSALPEPPAMTLWDPGFPEWESKVRLAPGTLSVVTGHPGHGKTALMNQVWFNVVKRYEVPMAIATFETRAKPHGRRQLRSLYWNKLEREMDDHERAMADAWIEPRYFFMVHPQGQPTLDWFLDMAEIAVIRHGCKIVQADPWNRFESSRRQGERDDEYILRALRAMYQFAIDLSVHVQVIAHPSKMDAARRGQPPELEDIAGAKHWDNVVDQGFTVHRPQRYEKGEIKTGAFLYHRKARFEELGYPCKLGLDYKIKEGRYVSADYDIV